jgi:hypothetical protein
MDTHKRRKKSYVARPQHTRCATQVGFMPHVDPTTCEGTEEGNSLSACNLSWDLLSLISSSTSYLLRLRMMGHRGRRTTRVLQGASSPPHPPFPHLHLIRATAIGFAFPGSCGSIRSWSRVAVTTVTSRVTETLIKVISK